METPLSLYNGYDDSNNTYKYNNNNNNQACSSPRASVPSSMLDSLQTSSVTRKTASERDSVNLQAETKAQKDEVIFFFQGHTTGKLQLSQL